MRRLAALTTALAGLALAVPAAEATPVKCKATDVTIGDRVFPEPEFSTNYVRFDEFECGIALLERTFPGKVEVDVLGRSKGGHPLYDVVITDEAAKGKKEKLLVVNSIHGDEVAGREGGMRNLEDLVDPRFVEPFTAKLLADHEVHFLFPNPDGWVKGDVIGPGAGPTMSRGNQTGRDLNRNFPVKGYINAGNGPLAEPESRAIDATLFKSKGWFLGTDNHGQLNDTYAAAGLQIVGQFDYQKSETLARFADGITEGMKKYGVLQQLEQLRAATGQDLGAYHWGTLYDMLGYSASGSMIDYYNTVDGIGGTGFATEMTVAKSGVNWAVYPRELNAVWVDSVRAINNTMFAQAVDRKRHTFPVGSKAAYVFDPAVIRHDDENGAGEGDAGAAQQPYEVTRMRFFEDLNDDADRPLAAIRVPDVLKGRTRLADFDSIVLANDPMPEGTDEAAWYAALKAFVQGGGNLVVTDAAAPALARLGLVPEDAITSANHYVGFVDFPADRSHPLNRGLRGVASQTYDTVPIGYSFGGQNAAPNWKVATAAWQQAGGTTAGTNGSGRTIYGEAPLGAGKVRFLGALLPDPTEEFFHPYGLQSYAVTYTGYTLLENMLAR